jgi:ChrR Cupin-like domain
LFSEQLIDIPQSQQTLNILEQKLAQRVQTSIAKHAGLRTVRSRDGDWKNLIKGIRYKSLWQSTLGNSVLIEFAPGASLPLHKHNYLEEGVVLSGSLNIDEMVLNQFDYHVSPAGSHHGKIWSKAGGMAFLRGSSVGETFSMLKEVLGGLLPKNQSTSTSIKVNDNEWIEVQDGVFRKQMWDDGEFVSQFFRLEPDAKIDGRIYCQDEERMILSGDLFLGDILLQAGDYQLARKGQENLDIYTDTGALYYVRGAVD